MKKGQKETKVTKAVTAKPKSAVKKAASAKVAPKKGIKEIVASSASPLVANETRASTRRNAAADIHRTDRFKNISDGVIPFKYTYGVSNKSNLNIRDTVVLCQKAYYNFAVFRNTIDMMTEFSTSDVYYRGGSKKSREFFEALFGKIGLWSVMDKFFREYYRSGNVFVYRFDALLKDSDVKKITKTFGSSRSEKHLPVRYTILNPADIQIQGGLNFVKGIYYKILTDYELARLRNPRTEEDAEVLSTLPSGVREQIKNTKSNLILVPLDSDKINAVFYKKQDYEPFSVPMGYPVLEDINWKAEMKKMDMAVARTMQQAILLITMGTEPDKGGVNQKNLAAMQTLFTNESVGRVLIADYTTKAEFVIPEIGNLLGPEKYEVVDRDIQSGLQNILLSGEKFANQSIKIDVFMARLRQARESFINEFLLPEIKRVSQTMGFKNYPTPYFEHICLSDDATKSRVINRLIELGILTAEEGLTAIDSGRLPTQEESEESQKRFRKLKESGLYEPLVGGGAHPHNPNLGGQPSPQKGPQENGRPPGTGVPKETNKVSPVGQGEQSKAEKEGYSLQKISTNMISANSLVKGVEASLRKYHKIKRLSKRQKSIAHDIVGVIIANEEPQNWRKSIDKYVKKPVDTNDERISKIREISARHHVDEYLASILYISKV
jgi:hypothetical protein